MFWKCLFSVVLISAIAGFGIVVAELGLQDGMGTYWGVSWADPILYALYTDYDRKAVVLGIYCVYGLIVGIPIALIVKGIHSRG